MSYHQQDLDDEGDSDRDLILDYLSNELAPVEANRLEERARHDRAFRHKLADTVLLNGLVMMALEREAPSLGGECDQAQRLFRAYSRGETDPTQTARLSRHLDECFDCEMEVLLFRDPAETAETRLSWWARCRGTLSRLIHWRPW